MPRRRQVGEWCGEGYAQWMKAVMPEDAPDEEILGK